jgi:hypothetical protein
LNTRNFNGQHSAPGDEEIARRHGVASVNWEDFLISGPGKGQNTAAR